MIKDRVIKCIATLAGRKPEEIKPEHSLVGDLDMDSLDLIEAVMFVEEEFEIELNDQDVGEFKTVADVIALVGREVGVAV